MTPTTCSTIRDRVNRLASIDVEKVQFGAGSHQYRFGPALLESDCESIEGLYGISLPTEYRWFITSVGNGGVGPGYGLERFAAADSESNLPYPEHARMERPNVVRFGRQYPGARRYYDVAGNELDPWAFQYFDLAKRYAGDGEWRGCLRQPFNFEKPFRVVSDELVQQGMANWTRETRVRIERDVAFYRDLRPNGAMRICHYGCDIHAYLVLEGPFRGDIWIHDPVHGEFVPASMRSDLMPQGTHNDLPAQSMRELNERLFSATRDGPHGERWGFLRWYDTWLDGELQNVAKEYTPERIEKRRAARASLETLRSTTRREISQGQVDGVGYTLYGPEESME